jgi:hypothetical protein
MVLLMCAVAFRLFSDARKGLNTGEVRVIGQISGAFRRVDQPLLFWFATAVAIFLGLVQISAAVIISVELVSDFTHRI